MTARAALALQATRRALTTSVRTTSSLSRPNIYHRSTSARRQPLLSRTFCLTSHSRSPQSDTPMAAHTDTQAAQVASESNIPITPESLTSKLQQSINITHINVEDMSGGCGQAFNAIIVSPEFEKKTLLARSRLVNGALKDEIRAIHAWTPRCLTPEQWEKEQERIG